VGEVDLQTAPGSNRRLMEELYQELRSLAECYLRRERPDHTLQATALVHETYLRLARSDPVWQDAAHFYRVAATVMRRILVNHAVERGRLKRGANRKRVPLTDSVLTTAGDAALTRTPDEELVQIDDLLEVLGRVDARKMQVVELRYFAGLSVSKAAEVLGLSERTVEREWRSARAWLLTRIRDSRGDGAPG